MSYINDKAVLLSITTWPVVWPVVPWSFTVVRPTVCWLLLQAPVSGNNGSCLVSSVSRRESHFSRRTSNNFTRCHQPFYIRCRRGPSVL